MKLNKIMLLLTILSLFGSSTKGMAEAPTYNELKPIKVYAFEQVLDKWGSEQWGAFDKIISKESNNWNVTTEHYKSGYTKDGIKSSAYGLGGFLDGTWKTVGCIKTSDEYKQIDCAILYINDRYKTPEKALDFHNKNNHY